MLVRHRKVPPRHLQVLLRHLRVLLRHRKMPPRHLKMRLRHPRCRVRTSECIWPPECRPCSWSHRSCERPRSTLQGTSLTRATVSTFGYVVPVGKPTLEPNSNVTREPICWVQISLPSSCSKLDPIATMPRPRFGSARNRWGCAIIDLHIHGLARSNRVIWPKRDCETASPRHLPVLHHGELS